MISAIFESLSNIIDLFSTLVKSLFRNYIAADKGVSPNKILNTDYMTQGIGDIIIILIAVSLVFFCIKGIIKFVWGR